MTVSPATRLLRHHVRREKGAMIGAALSTLVSTAADLAQPWPLALVVDRIFADHRGGFDLTSQDIRLLVVVVLATIGIALADATAQYLSDLWLQRAGERISHRLRDETYAHLQRLSLGYHQRRAKGDLVTRVTADVNAIGDLFSQQLGPMAQNALLVVGMLAVVVVVDPVVALAAFAMTPPLAALSWFFRRRVRAQARLRRRHDGAIASMANEALSAMPVVKAHGTEAREHARIRDRSEERMGIGMRLARMQARFDGAVGTLSAVGLALVIVVGVLRGSAGALTAGQLVVLVSYARKAHSPLRTLAKQASKVASAMASAERVADILQADEVLEERPGAYRGGPARGELQLRGASFAYRPDRPAVLDDVTLEIAAGSRVALIGASGAGKTTVGALVARFYDPTAGRVLLDGRDLRDCDLSWLRAQIGVLLQETVLFSGTVEENIAYGSDAGPDEIRAAAITAGADRFISSLPDGYATELGPQGVGLSGGQRQRIGIARTLLRDPPVLLLDEPTTGLDAESQEHVMEGLGALMRGRTTVLITHALELARSADQVIVMQDGRIARMGPPEDVLDALEPDQGDALSPRRRAPVRDPRLPQLGRLLDPPVAAAALERSLHAGRHLEDLTVERVAYKPGAHVAVHYEVAIDGKRHDAVVTAIADGDLRRRARRQGWTERAEALDGSSVARHALTHDGELDAMISWLPFDVRLPGLAVPAAGLAARLRDAGVALHDDAGPPQLINYKPRSRAVLRLNGHVMKAYGRDRRFHSAVAAMRAADAMRLPTAGLEAAFADLRLTVQKALEGAVPASADEVAREAGTLLRRLQESPHGELTETGHDRLLAAAARKAEVVGAVLPDRERRLSSLLRRLVSTVPRAAERVPAHGDFHPDQMVAGAGGLAVVDLDDLCLADPALDLATFVADVVRGRGGDLERVHTVHAALMDGYGTPPETFGWYLGAAILGRVAHPFQRQLEDWPDRVDAMITAAEEAVH